MSYNPWYCATECTGMSINFALRCKYYTKQ